MPRPIVPFPAFQPGAPVIPKLYWDALSQEQRIHKICEALHKLCEYANQLAGGINADHVVIEQLLAEFEQFKDSGFEDYYEVQLNQWIHDNAATLFESLAKLVLFGLDDDGHFAAYIPESWSDIWFDTIATYADPNYGHLCILWDGNGDFSNPHGPSSNANSYELLQYKPRINGVELTGNKSLSDLGLVAITEQQVIDAFGGE